MLGISIGERNSGNIHQRGEFWKYFHWEGCLEQGVREGPWEHYLREIENFFATYKVLQNQKTEVLGFFDADKAIDSLDEARKNYLEEKVKKHH